MRIRISVIFFALLFSTFSNAQKINFKVLNVTNGLPESDVKVFKLPEHLFMTYSDKQGVFSQFIAQEDTLQLTKEGFHDLMIKVHSNNFDSSYSVVLGLVPLSKKDKSGRSSYKDVESFEYHFIHDTLGANSQMKVNVLENVQVVRQRSKSRDQSFKIGAVDIDSPPPVDDPKKTYKSPYRLIK